ncbi:MAG TPA: hypothetical protein PKN04_16930, partial [bacterium]|nr:hypothetical protein [bacterium]
SCGKKLQSFITFSGKAGSDGKKRRLNRACLPRYSCLNPIPVVIGRCLLFGAVLGVWISIESG